MPTEFKQSQMNIGTLGHVDHGKTTLTYAITHSWTDVHSESVKRSMTIKLGYSDAVISKCAGKEGYGAYTTGQNCDGSGSAEPVRRISILDAPGHETLMATAIAGSSIIDAVLFVIAATEPVPMPQTKEHLMLINALGIKNAVIAQTKIDIVGKDAAKKNYEQIRNFIRGSTIESADIVPVIANKNANVDVVLQEIAELPLPKRDTESEPIMYVARSFDVNRPGTKINGLKGGVVGGSIIRGRFRVGDEIEIRPGVSSKAKAKAAAVPEPIITHVESLSADRNQFDEAIAGGLIAIGTDLDPSLTKADALVGQVVGHVGKLPEVIRTLVIDYEALNRDDLPKQGFRNDEPLLLGIGTGTNVGYIKNAKRNRLEIELKYPACIDTNAKISMLRNFSQRWRLSGYGTLAH